MKFLLIIATIGLFSAQVYASEDNCELKYSYKAWYADFGFVVKRATKNLNDCIALGSQHFGQTFKNNLGTTQEVNFVTYEYFDGSANLLYSGTVEKK